MIASKQIDLCRKTAINLLLAQEHLTFPIEPHTLQTGISIFYDSVQGYCHTVGLPISSFCCDQIIQDGCTIFSGDRSFYLILYNEWDSSPARRRFTLAHELGHILLTHGDDSDQSERSANCFASELLIPRVCFSYFFQAGWKPSATQISHFFGVSLTAAQLALKEPSNTLPSAGESTLLDRIRSSLDLFLHSCLEPIITY